MNTESQEERLNPFTKAAYISIVSLILGLLFDYLVYGHVPGISFPIYVAVITGAFFLLAWALDKKPDTQVYALLVPLFFFSIMVAVRASMLLTLLNMMAAFLLLMLIAKLLFEARITSYKIKDYFIVLLTPLECLVPLFESLGNLFLMKGVKKDQKVIIQVIKGIAIAIPFLIVFLLLFASADLIFQKYLTSIFDLTITPELIVRAILVIAAALSFIGVFTFIFSKRAKEIQVVQELRTGSLGHIESSIVLGSINALFLIFIIIQLAYLFGGTSNISAQGFTYAQYARRGFFELIAVAVISFLLLYALEMFIARKDDGHTLLFKLLSTALVVQVVVIMASSFMRLWLYEQAYGFTTLRLYSHVFIVFLAVIFCLMVVKILVDNRENTFAFRSFLAIVFFLALMNALNPDAFIADRNLERYGKTGQLDTDYVSRLSEDAIPVTIRLLDDKNPEVRGVYGRNLYYHVKEVTTASAYTGWQSTNLSRKQAMNILEPRASDLKKYKDFTEKDLKKDNP